MSKTQLGRLIKEARRVEDCHVNSSFNAVVNVSTNYAICLVSSQLLCQDSKLAPWYTFGLLTGNGIISNMIIPFDWTRIFLLDSQNHHLLSCSIHMNQVLNKLFKLPTNEVAIINLSPLFCQITYPRPLQLDVCTYSTGCTKEYLAPIPIELSYVSTDTRMPKYSWLLSSIYCIDFNAMIPIMDFLLIELDSSIDVSLLQQLDVNYGTAQLRQRILCDPTRAVKLGSFLSMSVILLPLVDRCSIESKRDFVRFIRNLDKFTEDGESKEFTCLADLHPMNNTQLTFFHSNQHKLDFDLIISMLFLIH